MRPVSAGARRSLPGATSAVLAGMVALASGALLAGCVRSTAQVGPGAIRPEVLLLQQHRQLVEEGQRRSRQGTPPPRAQWETAGNPIVQIPIDTSPSGSAAANGNFVAKTLPVVPMPPPPCPYDPAATPAQKTASLLVTFPSLSWHVCVSDNRRTSLWIGPVHMQVGPNDPWVKVIERAGLGEIFVPYHQINFRPYDLQATYQLQTVEPQDLVPGMGMLVQLTNEPLWPTVVATTRDRGIGWICPGKPTRRSEEFLIWGVADGGNYDNVIEYGFRDDGSITFQVGNTGYNSPPNSVEPHTHNALWYVDTELTPFGNPLGEAAYWLTHVEPVLPTSPNSAADLKTPITVESAYKWDERDFASLVVEDGIGNPMGHNIGFEFSPLRNSLSRHFGPKETWTQNDVYVTRAHSTELAWIRNWDEPDDYLMTYLNGESVVGEDLAIWIKTAAHHHPTDEDRTGIDYNTGGTTGVTLMHWSGFKMEPRNFFPRNPLGGPVRCGP